MPSTSHITVLDAHLHNLKHVSLSIPRDAVVVFTGVSGSGKSSLAFGTIYAEAQRRYLESVAPYARRLIEQAEAPEVEAIEGLPPAVALQQGRGTPSARSSVGSLTTISSLLRLLYSRAGTYPPQQPMLYAEDFSPNTPQGACPGCHGLGGSYEVDERAMVPDDRRTIRDHAIAAWPAAWGGQNLRDILVSLGIDVDRPWRALPKKQRDWILYTDETPTVPVYAGYTPAHTRAALRRKETPSYQGTFTSARAWVMRTFTTSPSGMMRRKAARFLRAAPCPRCGGKRLKREALSVTFAGFDIGELSHMPLARVAEVLRPAAASRFSAATPLTQPLDPRRARADIKRRVAAGGSAHTGASDVRRTPDLSEEKRVAAQRLARGIVDRLEGLAALGLGYLQLDRATPTLSAGELQRLRLATQLHSNLFGVVYVLDEPTAGLHPSDSAALLDAIDGLKRAGNSVFVVEHDLEIMRRADWLIDVGPGAGERGGEVLYNGPPAGLRDIPASATARHLFGSPHAPPRQPRLPAAWLKLADVTRNNLRDLHVDIPLGVLAAVTGVSGSGKSSLVSDALVQLVSDRLGGEPDDGEDVSEITDPEVGPITAPLQATGRIIAGAEHLTRLVRVDQRPIGRTPRSNLATYTGLFDHVRKLFAATDSARARRWDAGWFSFNVAKGRCPTCDGEGFVSIELLFMPSAYAPCPVCRGARYAAQTLDITVRGLNIAQVLALTVDDARDFFAEDEALRRPLDLLAGIGLGYLRLGQPATELSGGEAQRIKLATELQRVERRGTLYVLDEPTTGLHPADVELLMTQLQRLVDSGSSVVLVEHDPDVLVQCDWIIDLGPGAGDAGGRVIAAGAPIAVAGASGSRTGAFLRSTLERRHVR